MKTVQQATDENNPNSVFPAFHSNHGLTSFFQK